MFDQTTAEGLLALATQGDRKALAELYDRFAPRLLGIIRRVLSDRKESERVLEDIFLKLWREAAAVGRAKVSVAAWLVLAARTEAGVRLSARAGRPPQPGPNGSAESWFRALAWLPPPGAIARLEERRTLLQKVLSQLPRHQLRALELVAFAGRAESDLERDLGQPRARVCAELRAAARFLRHRRRAVIGSWAVSL